MFDPDLISLLDEDQQKIVKSAIRSIVISGIVDAQLQRMVDRIREGDFDEDDEKLSSRIKEFRWKAAGLRSFKQFGESIIQETR